MSEPGDTYHITLTFDRDIDGNEGWVAEVEEMPGCLSQGDDPVDATEHIADAMRGWWSVANARVSEGPHGLPTRPKGGEENLS